MKNRSMYILHFDGDWWHADDEKRFVKSAEIPKVHGGYSSSLWTRDLAEVGRHVARVPAKPHIERLFFDKNNKRWSQEIILRSMMK